MGPPDGFDSDSRSIRASDGVGRLSRKKSYLPAQRFELFSAIFIRRSRPKQQSSEPLSSTLVDNSSTCSRVVLSKDWPSEQPSSNVRGSLCARRWWAMGAFGGGFAPAQVRQRSAVGPDLVEHLGVAAVALRRSHARRSGAARVGIQQLDRAWTGEAAKSGASRVGLRPCPSRAAATRRGSVSTEGTNDPFIRPVACELEQHTGRVMLQRPSEQERVELLAIAGARRSPAQPGEHERPVITPGATFPAPIGGQPAHVLGREPQQTGKPIDRGVKDSRTGHPVSSPATAAHRAELRRRAGSRHGRWSQAIQGRH